MYLNRQGSHQEGPCFSNQGLSLGPVVEKAKAAFIQNQLAMTRGILFHKGQPCPTSSDLGQMLEEGREFAIFEGVVLSQDCPNPLKWHSHSLSSPHMKSK